MCPSFLQFLPDFKAVDVEVEIGVVVGASNKSRHALRYNHHKYDTIKTMKQSMSQLRGRSLLHAMWTVAKRNDQTGSWKFFKCMDCFNLSVLRMSSKYTLAKPYVKQDINTDTKFKPLNLGPCFSMTGKRYIFLTRKWRQRRSHLEDVGFLFRFLGPHCHYDCYCYYCRVMTMRW